jgi:hypothetical protein
MNKGSIPAVAEAINSAVGVDTYGSAGHTVRERPKMDIAILR